MSAQKNILLADDDHGILDALTIMLQDIGGYKVTTTVDGETLLNMPPNEHPDLILLDLWMSGMDGSDICKKLKSDEQTKHIPVIIFSANRDIRSIANEAGADDYITKPFQMNELLTKIHSLL